MCYVHFFLREELLALEGQLSLLLAIDGAMIFHVLFHQSQNSGHPFHQVSISTIVLHESHEPVETNGRISFTKCGLSVFLKYSIPLLFDCLTSALSNNLLKTDCSPSRGFPSAGVHFSDSSSSVW